MASGKVTTQEMQSVQHHLLNIADPTQTYTANDFVHDATVATTDIIHRQHLPIIAGGTFFYIDAFLGHTTLPSVPPNIALRDTLDTLSTTELMEKLATLDQARAGTIDTQNPRRIIRAIEIATALGHVPKSSPADIPYEVLKIGITIAPVQLQQNIHTRLHERLAAGMVKEIETLLEQGITHERLESLGLECRYISRYLRKEMTYDDMCTILETKIRQFAKRQCTWLKRDKTIQWINPENMHDITQCIDTFLAQHPIPRS